MRVHTEREERALDEGRRVQRLRQGHVRSPHDSRLASVFACMIL